MHKNKLKIIGVLEQDSVLTKTHNNLDVLSMSVRISNNESLMVVKYFIRDTAIGLAKYLKRGSKISTEGEYQSKPNHFINVEHLIVLDKPIMNICSDKPIGNNHLIIGSLEKEPVIKYLDGQAHLSCNFISAVLYPGRLISYTNNKVVKSGLPEEIEAIKEDMLKSTECSISGTLKQIKDKNEKIIETVTVIN